MSAREDAAPQLAARASRAPRVRPRQFVIPLVGALLGVALVGALAERFAPDRLPRYEALIAWHGAEPTAAEWPRPARAGESAELQSTGENASRLAVRSFTSAEAQSLGRALWRRRASGVDAASLRRAEVRARWRAALVPGPLPAMSPPAECAVWLRARRLLALAAVGPSSAPAPPAGVAAGERERLVRAEAEVARLALGAQPDSLAGALTACAGAEGDWLAALGPAGRERLAGAWDLHERERAVALDTLARALERSLPPQERATVPAAAQERVFVLERLAPEPAAALFVHGDWGATPEARPIARTWALLLGAGALVGALVGLGLGLGAALARPASRRARRLDPRLRSHALLADVPDRAEERGLAAESSWLHVVSGPDSSRIGQTVAALVASFLARAERVLVLDAGRRLRLHERFAGEARWGLGECLAGEVPLLGAVQLVGEPGFYFLAHGAPGRAERWDQMSRILEEAHAHFDRVILALDARVPREAALPLGGRVLEAWWGEPGPALPRSALALSERLGIAFSGTELSRSVEAMLEAEGLPGRDSSVPAALPGEGEASTPAAAGEAAVLPLVEEPGPARETPASAPAGSPLLAPDAAVVAEPLVLGCDLEVRERLRFLIWMRRLQAETRSRTLESRASG